MAAELDGAPLIGDGAGGVHGEVGGALDDLRRQRLALQRRSAAVARTGVGATAASAMRAFAHLPPASVT